MPRFLVTGGAGFIGSNLVRHLTENGERVIVIDNLSTGKKENLAGLERNVDFIEGDIRDISLLKERFVGVETVFHQAALPSVPRSVRDPLLSNANNIDGTLDVLVAAKDMGVRRVVLAASSSAYGDTEVLPKTEDMPGNPLSPYAVTKYVGELYAKVFTRLYGLETVALRYFNVFGPRQDPESQYAAVIPKFIISILNGESPRIYGDGEQSRDFTFVDNVVRANVLAAEAKDVAGEVFNVGCGARYSLNYLLERLNTILGTDISAVYDQPRPGDIKHSQASIEKANRLLGYTPMVTFNEGLRKTVGWFCQSNAYLT
jgi:nucleoside-diphosphate-sugar epimerase